MRQKQSIFSLFLLSPSSRRAWIEIIPSGLVFKIISVALLAEGVDRNILLTETGQKPVRRPPRRGCG